MIGSIPVKFRNSVVDRKCMISNNKIIGNKQILCEMKNLIRCNKGYHCLDFLVEFNCEKCTKKIE